MAKRVLGEPYTFNAATRTIVVSGKAIRRETLVLILNVTTNTVIFNFSDSTLTATAYTATTTATGSNLDESTTIVLAYNTTSMSNTDKLSIIVDEVTELMYPAEVVMDPVQKLRVSTPQALIDTDFEYSTQPTKWETITLMNNRPSAFYDASQPLTSLPTTPTFIGASGAYTVTNITGAGTRLVTVALNNTTGITTSTPVFIQDTIDPNANGWVLPITVTANTSFTYWAAQNIASQSIYDITKTYIYIGSFFTGAGIPVSTTAGAAFTYSGTAVTCTTTMNHGLQPGNAIFVLGTTGATNNPNGPWTIRQTPTSNTFIFDVVNAPTAGTISVTAPGSGLTVNTTVTSGIVTNITISAAGSLYTAGDVVLITGGGSNAFAKVMSVGASGAVTQVQLYAGGSGYTGASAVATTMSIGCNTLFTRTYGSSIHRPFDGGVNFTAGTPYNGTQTIRQTRRYFRYQSGKGMQFSTGSNLMPPVFLDNLTASGTTITVGCKLPHNLGVGANIAVSGAVQSAYNGNFVVTATPSLVTLQYTALSAPNATPATGWPINVQPRNWYGAAARVGMFDNQNGFYWEFDGQQLYAVQRSSTQQLAGVITTAYSGNVTIIGTNTRFSEQLIPGDQVVLRGMTYTVQAIQSDTVMVMYPEYRGTHITFPSRAIMSKTVNTRTPITQFNIDRLDGTGVSGYTIDVSKMQMWYIDYSWYGAGAIRFGVKDQRGEVKYAHRIANANRNTEAYMRSGNLPARYEVNTNYPFTVLRSTLANTETTTVNVRDTTGFPPSGTIIVFAPANTGGAIEFINYTGRTATTFTGLTRQVTNLSGPGGLTNLGGTGTAQTFTFSATAPVAVGLYAPQAGVTIGHWGSSVIMDGRYDDDKSFVFNYGQNAQVTYGVAGQRYPVFSVRVSPSVDSGIPGILGAREIINRMQLTLRSVGVLSTGASVRVELFLNGRITGTPTSWINVGGSSLAQYCVHTTSNGISGGEPIYTFFNIVNTSNAQDMSLVRDLGNSILGGGNNNTVTLSDLNKYPDGPDQVTICVIPLSANAVSALRLNWTEAQA